MNENIQKLNEAIKGNEELQAKLAAVTDAAGLDTFLAGAGLTLSAEEKTELLAIFTVRAGGSKLSEDELEDVAGGLITEKPQAYCFPCGKAISAFENYLHKGLCDPCDYYKATFNPAPGPCPRLGICSKNCPHWGNTSKCVAGVIQ